MITKALMTTETSGSGKQEHPLSFTIFKIMLLSNGIETWDSLLY
jgi:hypothetical protein